MVETFGQRARRLSELFKQADEKKKEQEDKLAEGVISDEIGIRTKYKRPPGAVTASALKGIVAAFVIILGCLKWGVV